MSFFTCKIWTVIKHHFMSFWAQPVKESDFSRIGLVFAARWALQMLIISSKHLVETPGTSHQVASMIKQNNWLILLQTGIIPDTGAHSHRKGWVLRHLPQEAHSLAGKTAR